MPSTARQLGTSSTGLAAMTDAEQMQYVRKYFLGVLGSTPGRARSLSDLYMAVLYPVAVGKPDSYVLFQSPSTAYTQNAGLDYGGKGYVTKSDAASAVQGIYNAAGGRRIEVVGAGDAPLAQAGVITAAPQAVLFAFGIALGVGALWVWDNRKALKAAYR